MRLALLFAPLFLAPAAFAQITPVGGTVNAFAHVVIPGCDLTDGGVGSTEASTACSLSGYAAAADSTSTLTVHSFGGIVTGSAAGGATVPGLGTSGQSNANGSSSAVHTWQLGGDTHYTLQTEISGGGVVNFGSSLPPSGILSAGFYGLAVSASIAVVAFDSMGPETVNAVPESVMGRVTFAEFGSPTLIKGQVLAGGAAQPGLLIEALDGAVIVATAFTANDGAYLLPDLGPSVRLRISDPQGIFATQFSPPVAPPATFDADLGAAVPIPPPVVGFVLVALGLTGALSVRKRRPLLR